MFENSKKVTFNIASEASNVYISSDQKFIRNAKNSQFWQVFENLKLVVKSSLIGQKLVEKVARFARKIAKWDLLSDFSNSIEHSKAYVNFGKWTNTTWQRQKQLKQREGKKMEAPVNRLCSCFSYAICKAPFDNWSFSSWKSFLSSNGKEMKHQHCYFCTFPHCLKTT